MEQSYDASQLKILSDAINQLAVADNPEETLKDLLESVTARLGLDVFVYYRIAEEHRSLRLGCCGGVPQEAAKAMEYLPFGESIAGRVAQQEAPILLENVQDAGNPETKAIRALGIKAHVCFPLLAQGRLRGTLCFASRDRARFTNGEVPLLEFLCAQIAMALEQARLTRLLDQRAQELAEVDRHRDEFLSMLAHELRNPLSPIMCAMEVMRLSGIGNPSQERSMDIVERQAQHMARLLDDLLDVSRLRRGKIELRKEPIELTAVIEQAAETSMPFINSRKHKFTVSLPSEPVWLEADPTRMEQILTNLLNNAAKYTEPGGNINITAMREGNEVVIKIKDSGIGIPPEKMAGIFDIFIQSERVLDSERGGLGIGLTLVRRLVEMHNGAINATSAGLGKGSEFVLRLPALLRAPWMSEEIAPDVEGAIRRHRRILIVEDNVDSAKSLGELLELWGHEINIAYDGPMAIEEADKYRPDVVLLDIGLPGMSGYQVARELRKHEEPASALIIAVTGYGQVEDKELSKEAGIDHHITKPIDFATLEELLG